MRFMQHSLTVNVSLSLPTTLATETVSEDVMTYRDNLHLLIVRHDLLPEPPRGFRITDHIAPTVIQEQRQILWPSVPACFRVERHPALEHVRDTAEGTDLFAVGVDGDPSVRLGVVREVLVLASAVAKSVIRIPSPGQLRCSSGLFASRNTQSELGK